MNQHRYPLPSLYADYARAALGIAVTGIPMVMADLSGIAGTIVGLLAVVFIAYGARTAMRQFTVYEVSDQGIRAIGPLGRAIAWADLTDVQVRYYSTRRDNENGWMQLKVFAAQGNLSLDSSLEGFDELILRAVRVAETRGLELNETTLENLKKITGSDKESEACPTC